MSLTFKPGQKFHHKGTGTLLVIRSIDGRGRDARISYMQFDADSPHGAEAWVSAHVLNYNITHKRLFSYVGRHCRVCGCVDIDCRRCMARTGRACHWIEDDLCSACEGAKP